MTTTELNMTDELRTISDEELADVAGGFQVYTGGGGGRMAPHVVSSGPSAGVIAAGWIITVGTILGLAL